MRFLLILAAVVSCLRKYRTLKSANSIVIRSLLPHRLAKDMEQHSPSGDNRSRELLEGQNRDMGVHLCIETTQV